MGEIKRFLLTFWKRRPPKYILPMIEQGTEIPRAIYQVGIGKNRSQLPSEINENIRQICANNPGWDYKYFDQQDARRFIMDHAGPPLLGYFDRIAPEYGAAKADLFRYFLIYVCGGVYLDLKSSIRGSLAQCLLPSDRFLLSHWRNGPGEEFEGFGIHDELRDFKQGEFQIWHIVAVRGHPFLRASLLNVLSNLSRYSPLLDGTGTRGVLRVTGPIAFTQAVGPIIGQHEHRVVDIERDCGFQVSIYPKANGPEHKHLFRWHYSEQTRPIVEPDTGDRVVHKLQDLRIKIRRVLGGARNVAK